MKNASFFLPVLLLLLATCAQAQNTSYGVDALPNNTGSFNCAFGVGTLKWNTTGLANSAFGSFALVNNTTGSGNCAFGREVLLGNTSGYDNSAFGPFALSNNSTGYRNAAVGLHALRYNTTGYENSAVGPSALYFNTTGYGNSAVGREVLYNNTTGRFNAALGDWAMRANTTGFKNAAVGNNAMYANTTGNDNSALGNHALEFNTTGNFNASFGSYAGYRNSANHNCSYFGYDANDASLGTFVNSTALGTSSRITANHQVRIGSTSALSVGGYTGWTILSDGRYKRNVREDVKGLEFILQLRPVTYNMDVRKLNHDMNVTGALPTDGKDKSEDLAAEGLPAEASPPSASLRRVTAAEGLPAEASPPSASLRRVTAAEGRNSGEESGVAEKEAVRYTGFIAQEVERAAQSVNYDFSGVDKPKNERDHYGLRYDEFVVPLVKAVQEQQATLEAQSERIAALEHQLSVLLARLDGQSTPLDPPVNAASPLTLFPNPVADALTIGFALQQAGEVRFSISDASGKTVLSKAAGRFDAGSHLTTLAVGSLPAGAYFLHAVLGSGSASRQFQVKK